MGVLPIIIWPNPVLREVSEPVDPATLPALQGFIDDLFSTMYDAGGVGLAAIQVGNGLRIFVADTGVPMVFVNPMITDRVGQPAPTREGCLSLPGIWEEIERWPGVIVRYLDRNGAELTSVCTDQLAQCVQHEIEHLDGIAIPDHFGAAKRELILKKLEKRR